jgi:hypothetical protein
LRKDVLDRAVWGIRCGRGYGHVVRQYGVNGYGKTAWAWKILMGCTYMWVERIRAIQENVGRKSVGQSASRETK